MPAPAARTVEVERMTDEPMSPEPASHTAPEDPRAAASHSRPTTSGEPIDPAGPVDPVAPASSGVQWGEVLRNALLVLVLFVMLWLAFHVKLPSAQVLRDQLNGWGGLAWAAFIVFYAALAVTPIPVSVLAIAGGVLFGVVEGSVLSVIGAMLGSWVAYWLARGLGKATVSKLLGSHAATVEERLQEAGTSGTYLLRLTPGLPYWVVNYGSGAFGVSQRSFLIGSALGAVPGQVSLVAIGAFITEPTVIHGTVIGVAWVVVLVLTLLAYRELRRARRARVSTSASGAAEGLAGQ